MQAIPATVVTAFLSEDGGPPEFGYPRRFVAWFGLSGLVLERQTWLVVSWQEGKAGRFGNALQMTELIIARIA